MMTGTQTWAVASLVREGVIASLARRFAWAGLDADDLAQEVAEKLLRRPIPEAVRVEPWLTRVIRNLAIDHLRQRRVRRADLEAESDTHGDPEAAWWEALSDEDVRAQVARLPGKQRLVFELFAFEGRSYVQIAARLGISKVTVGTRILRARQKLRELLTEAHGHAAPAPPLGRAPAGSGG
jgi:RNA polymerase sigma-70 factor (ECF subfamily)